MFQRLLIAVIAAPALVAGTAVAASAAPASPAAAHSRAIYGNYLAVMYARSLGQPFYFRSKDRSTAEGVAYNKCLRYAKAHLNVYKNDCNSGVWVYEGDIAVYESGPYTAGPDGHGQPYAFGLGWGRTFEQARSNAAYYCRYFGGQHCVEQIWYNDVFSVSGPKGPTTGGTWG